MREADALRAWCIHERFVLCEYEGLLESIKQGHVLVVTEGGNQFTQK